ncbi:hypothetical protein GCM10009647_051070 [Streptomyces sanglieri]|uniref:Transposase n=1 Tax=Streptomyces sanglieri TaxID=193460 RepID=A0ABW2WMI4_9ACTN
MTSSTWPMDTLQGAATGVARQYSGTLGKVGNCQVGVSVHAAPDTHRACCPGGCLSATTGTVSPSRSRFWLGRKHRCHPASQRYVLRDADLAPTSYEAEIERFARAGEWSAG